jgi:hypothetical protein
MPWPNIAPNAPPCTIVTNGKFRKKDKKGNVYDEISPVLIGSNIPSSGTRQRINTWNAMCLGPQVTQINMKIKPFIKAGQIWQGPAYGQPSISGSGSNISGATAAKTITAISRRKL